MKNKFQVGDLVRDKAGIPRVSGVGRVVEINVVTVKVEWPNVTYWEISDRLELAETPIERMKRRYSEGSAP